MADRRRRGPAKAAAAIDFGTHGTGFAWVRVGPDTDAGPRRAAAIRFRLEWPGLREAAGKTLSAVLVDKRGRTVAWGYPAQHIWLDLDNADARSGRRYYEAFKLALQKDKEEASISFAHMPTSEREATVVTSRYLREVYRQAVAEITVGAECFADEIDWCITVPSTWRPAAIARTRRAAEAAGFPGGDRLRVVYEPEAAALACRFGGLRGLGVTASRFLVVDCGGGTVDITSYTIDSGGRMHQVGQMTGRARGSWRLNRAFATDVLGARMTGGAVNRLVDKRNRGLARLIDRWEKAKHAVAVAPGHGDEVTFTRPVRVAISAAEFDALQADVPRISESLLATQGTNKEIAVSVQELDQMFAGVVDDIVRDVEKQLEVLLTTPREDGARDEPETVLLVGGFAKSEYLQQRLAQRLNGRAEVLVPEQGDLAVLAGAVHFCYDPSLLRRRRIRHTYGIAVARPFKPGTDPAWSRRGGYSSGYRTGVFQEIVRAGTDVAADFTTEALRLAPIDPNQRTAEVAVYRIRAGRRPRRVDGLKPVATVVIDLEATAGLPREDRAVELAFRFGRASIDVLATDVDSQHVYRAKTTYAYTIEQHPADLGPRTMDVAPVRRAPRLLRRGVPR